MPRKNARPAERKRRAKLKAKMAKKSEFRRRTEPYRRDPHLSDGLAIAAVAAGLFGITREDFDGR